MSAIPPAHHRIWSQVLLGEVPFEPHFLGLRLLLLRSKMHIERSNKNQQEVADFARELHDFFTKNEKFLTADIQALFG